MHLDKTEMNHRLIREWFKRYTTLDNNQVNMLMDIKDAIQSDLSLLYTMNKYIVEGNGEIFDKALNIEFICREGKCGLYTDKGEIIMEASEFRRILAAMIDIYEDMYPLGTVLDLKKEYYRDMLPVDEVEHIRVVVNYRFVPVSDDMYIPYVGSVYPIGNNGKNTTGIHFTPMTVEKVVHMGYMDEEETAYLFQSKLGLIVENNMHSTGFATDEEVKACQI